MKKFFNRYSYNIFKMFLFQFAISIFGFALAMTTTAAGGDVLTSVVSVFSIIFYLFLIYTMTWEIGAKDKISVEAGKLPYNPYTGLLMSLIANIPNFILALIQTFANVFDGGDTVNFVVRVIAMFFEGMYWGLMLVIKVGDTPLNALWWPYFIITVPALLTSWIAYYFGYKNLGFSAKIYAPSKPKKKNQ